MFGYRPDGKKVKDIDPIQRIIPHIMAHRHDSQNLTTYDCPCQPLDAFIKEEAPKGENYNYMHIVIAGLVRTIAKFPRINRFIMNGRIYMHNAIEISFVVKKNLSPNAADSLVKLRFTGLENIAQIWDKIDAAVRENNHMDANNGTDKLARILTFTPNLIIKCLVGIIKWLDRHSMLPDFILYMGDMLVSKTVRNFLRRAAHATVMMISNDGKVHDTTMHMDTVIEADPADVLRGFLYIQKEGVAESMPVSASRKPYLERWKDLHAKVERMIEEIDPPYSQMAAVRYFEQQLDDMEYDFAVHYANSSAVRLANIFAAHPVFCNRGVNGIDGSLSTAAGFSVVSNRRVFCVIGDLSFFYDQNALWNQNLNGNFRMILLNNGKGGIFDLLPGLEQSEASERFVSGAHRTSAQGICVQNDIGYLQAQNMAELQVGMVTLLTEERQRPLLLEVFTDSEADAQTFRAYLSCFKQNQSSTNNE